MARKRNPNRDKAYKLWLEDKERPLVDIAKELGERPSTVRKWKSQDNWERSDSKESAPIKKERSVKVNDPPKMVIDNDDLTEQQQLFCLYYLQSFNATKAYKQAYGCDYKTANANGSRLLVKDSIKTELNRLKAELQQEVYTDAKQLLNKLLQQAHADMKDYVEFGTKEIETGEFEEIVTDEIDADGLPVIKRVPKMYKYSFVHLNDSKEVDGTVIRKIKQGKDGISIELYDGQRALLEVLKRLETEDSQSQGDDVKDWKQQVIEAANKRARESNG